MKITTELLETITLNLRALPPMEPKRREHSKQEAVKFLSKEIVVLQKRGYNLEQISAALRGAGLDVATPTLKNYLQRAKPALKKKPSTNKVQDTPPRA